MPPRRWHPPQEALRRVDQPPPHLTPPAPGHLFRSELPTPLSPVSSRVSLPLRSWPPLLAGPQRVHVPRSVPPNPSQSRTTRHRPTPALRPQGPAGSLHTPRPTGDVYSELILLPHPPPHSLTHMLSHTCTHTHPHAHTHPNTHMYLDSHPHVCTLNPPSHMCSHTQAHTNTRSGYFTHFCTHKHTSDSCTCTLICTRSFRHKLTPAQPHSARPLHTHPHSFSHVHMYLHSQPSHKHTASGSCTLIHSLVPPRTGTHSSCSVPRLAHSMASPPALWARQPPSPLHSNSSHRRQATALPRVGTRISRPEGGGTRLYGNIPCVDKTTPLEKGPGPCGRDSVPPPTSLSANDVALVRANPGRLPRGGHPTLPASGHQQTHTEDLPSPRDRAWAPAPRSDCNLHVGTWDRQFYLSDMLPEDIFVPKPLSACNYFLRALRDIS